MAGLRRGPRRLDRGGARLDVLNRICRVEPRGGDWFAVRSPPRRSAAGYGNE
jgi:hypothetical protein